MELLLYCTVEDLVALIDVDKLDGEAKILTFIAAVAKPLRRNGKLKMLF